jgi:hypothetical protein
MCSVCNPKPAQRINLSPFSFQIVPAYMLRDQGKVLSPKIAKHAIAGDAVHEYHTARFFMM